MNKRVLLIVLIVIVVILIFVILFGQDSNIAEEPPSTELSCGDGVCTVGWETCLTCIKDCGACPTLCSNSLYAAENLPNERISLTEDSYDKLGNAMMSDGDMALEGIKDLTCITEFYATSLGMFNWVSKDFTNISALSNLTNLKTLYLTDTLVSDLSPLEGLDNLESLDLGSTEVKNLSPLSKLYNLRGLAFQDTRVSDLSPLSNLTNLEMLQFPESSVTDLSPISGLNNLRTLNLRNTVVTSLRPIIGLDNLQKIDAYGSWVSDISSIGDMENLVHIDLRETNVNIAECKSLESKIEKVFCPEKEEGSEAASIKSEAYIEVLMYIPHSINSTLVWEERVNITDDGIVYVKYTKQLGNEVLKMQLSEQQIIEFKELVMAANVFDLEDSYGSKSCSAGENPSFISLTVDAGDSNTYLGEKRKSIGWFEPCGLNSIPNGLARVVEKIGAYRDQILKEG